MPMENKNFNWQRETNPEKLNSNPYQVNVDAMPIQLNYMISLKQWTIVTNAIPIEYQWKIEYQGAVNGQLITNAIPIRYQWTIEYQWTVNGQLITNAIPINNQWTIEHQWIVN